MAENVPWEQLFEAAAAAQRMAHAPYSRFPVGAAILTEDGVVRAGCNVENSSYGLSLCAERNAIGRAVAEGQKRVLAVAVVANTEEPCPPCGMCRQAIAEFAEPGVPVRSRTPGGVVARYTVAELLPHAFSRRFL
jgi:cytidine deaminase